MKFTDKRVADVGILFKEGKELQMIIPNYGVELRLKEHPYCLNQSWYNSFLYGGLTSGDNVLRKIINEVEGKNKYSSEKKAI